MHKRNKGRGSLCICSKQIIVSKSGCGSQRERCSGSRHCASISCFLNFTAHVIQSRIIFKPGLTRMTRTKCDLGDPTRFQCCSELTCLNFLYVRSEGDFCWVMIRSVWPMCIVMLWHKKPISYVFWSPRPIPCVHQKGSGEHPLPVLFSSSPEFGEG